MNFLRYTRIFLAPISQAKWYTSTLIFEFFLYALLPITSVFFVGDMMRVLQRGDLDMLYHTMIWYTICFFSIVSFLFLMYRSGWVRFLETIQSILYRQYIHEFVQLDPQSIETIGTGKLLHMIQNGVKTHASSLVDVIFYGSKFLLVLGVAFWFILPLG